MMNAVSVLRVESMRFPSKPSRKGNKVKEQFLTCSRSLIRMLGRLIRMLRIIVSSLYSTVYVQFWIVYLKVLSLEI